MGIIKLGLISVLVFALLFTFISFFFPSHVRISKAIDIQADRATVQQQITDTSKWQNWYPGFDSSRAVSIPVSLKSASGWNIYDANTPNTVTVQWYMDFHLAWYPWEKFSSLLLEKRYGPLMEKGLSNLKRFLEK